MKAKTKTTTRRIKTAKAKSKSRESRSKQYVESDEVRAMRNDIGDMEAELAALKDDIAAVEKEENEEIRNVAGPAFCGLLGSMAGMIDTCKELQKGVEHIDRMMAGLGGEED